MDDTLASNRRVYLDQAATSWPKHESVYRAVDFFLREVGAGAARGAYAEAVAARKVVDRTRQSIANWIGASDPRSIVFTLNGTDALNMAIHGALTTGAHVVTTVAEHNSVLRPLAAAQDALGVKVARVGCTAEGIVDPEDIRRAIRPNTRLVAMLHASNVTGAIQPAAEVGRIAREHGVLFLLDAAQSIGEIPMNVNLLNVDFLAAPGHKGLLGPLGTGFLYVRPGVESLMSSWRQGGTGSQSDRDRQPDEMPEKLEAGNVNVPAIAGLGAGVDWLAQQGIEALRRHANTLTKQLWHGLEAIKGVRMYGPIDHDQRVALVSITLEGYDPQELAAALDSAFRVQVRAGLHCAPLMHRFLGTVPSGGTVRFSLGAFNTAEEVDIAINAVAEIAAQTPVV